MQCHSCLGKMFPCWAQDKEALSRSLHHQSVPKMSLVDKTTEDMFSAQSSFKIHNQIIES